MKIAKTAGDKYLVEAVARALDILDVFEKSEELSLTEIGERVRLNKTRVFRLLHTLVVGGYVQKSSDGVRYSLGVKLLDRASCVRADLRQIARPLMKVLLEKFNETVNLGILDGQDILYIEMLESSHTFRMAARVGSRGPVTSTALGRAIAAHLPANESANLIPSEPMSKLKGAVTISAAKLSRELQNVRARGYAIDDEENLPGAVCIGAPLFDGTGRPIAAVSLSGPADRIHTKSKEIASFLPAVCREISRKLGYRELNEASKG